MRFPEFGGEWEENEFKSLFSIGNGKDYKHLKEGDVPVFGTGGLMTYVNQKLHSGETVFIGRKGTINKPFYFQGDFWTVDTLFYTHSFKNVLPRFVFNLFERTNWLLYNEASGVPSLSKSTIESIKVNVPNIKEQQKISKLFDVLDKRIATQIKVIEDLKKLKSAIIETHYKQVAKQVVSISEVGGSFSVGNLSKEELASLGSPCILYGELFTTYGEVINQIVSQTTKTEGMTLSRKGDLLFPSSTTVDAMSLIAPSAIMVDNVILGGDMFGIHVNSNFNSQYLSYFFNHIAKKNLAKYAKGSTIIHLHYSDIANAKLSLPCLEEQNRMANCLIALDKKIEIEGSYLSSFEIQKQYLLRHLFI